MGHRALFHFSKSSPRLHLLAFHLFRGRKDKDASIFSHIDYHAMIETPSTPTAPRGKTTPPNVPNVTNGDAKTCVATAQGLNTQRPPQTHPPPPTFRFNLSICVRPRPSQCRLLCDFSCQHTLKQRRTRDITHIAQYPTGKGYVPETYQARIRRLGRSKSSQNR